jgi:hypothetical protein
MSSSISVAGKCNLLHDHQSTPGAMATYYNFEPFLGSLVTNTCETLILEKSESKGPTYA